MMYVGHFSFARTFDDDGSTRDPYHCQVSAVAKAPNVDKALDRFKSLLKKLARGKSTREMFLSVDSIYLDACIEVRSVPVAGLVTFLNMEVGESSGGIRTTLPDTPTRNAASYGVGDEPKMGETFTPLPFVVLQRRPAKAEPVTAVAPAPI